MQRGRLAEYDAVDRRAAAAPADGNLHRIGAVVLPPAHALATVVAEVRLRSRTEIGEQVCLLSLDFALALLW